MRNNRENLEIRPLSFDLNYLKYPDGSVLVALGETRVICTVMMETKVPPFAQNEGKGWLTSEYAMIPGSTDTRLERDIKKGRINGRSAEIQRLIGRSLRSITDLRSIPERTLWVDCDVIQADGGTRTAAINGAFVALNLALLAYLKRGEIIRWPLTNWMGAISAGIVDDEILLDLDYGEDSHADVDFNLIATASHDFVEIQGTAEAHPSPMPTLQELMNLALDGIDRVIKAQRDILQPYFNDLPAKVRDKIPEDYLI